MEKKSYKSWTISDGFWEAVKDEIPQRQRAESKTYSRKPGGGRKPLSKRRVLEGIFYVLRTGCQWKAVPKEYGAASSIHQYFQEWAAAGFFERIIELLHEAYDTRLRIFSSIIPLVSCGKGKIPLKGKIRENI